MDSKTDPQAMVVLSTYNGERYLGQQLDSLLGQTYKHVKIAIRDDGSTDSTKDILERYSKSYENIRVCFGINLGVVRSFFELLAAVPKNADYVFFCDQDDVWDQDKITRAVDLLSRHGVAEPAMYCGAVRLVDEQLREFGVVRQVKRGVAFENALLQNIAAGCTAVINNPALHLLLGPSVDFEKLIMHDWWVYKVVSAFGKVIYDSEPMMAYRQHGNNMIGSSIGVKLWMSRVARFVTGRRGSVLQQVQEFLRVYGTRLDADKRRIAKDFVEKSQASGLVERSVYAMKSPIYRQRVVDDLIARGLIIAGKI